MERRKVATCIGLALFIAANRHTGIDLADRPDYAVYPLRNPFANGFDPSVPMIGDDLADTDLLQEGATVVAHIDGRPAAEPIVVISGQQVVVEITIPFQPKPIWDGVFD